MPRSGSKRKRSRSRTSRPTGCLRLVRQDDDPVLVGGLREQLGLLRDRVEREVVERGHPARVGAPRPHEQVAEEREGPGAVAGPTHDDRLVARPSGRRSGRPTRPAGARFSPSAQPSAPQSWTSAAPAGRTRRRAAGCRRARPPTPPSGRRSSRAGRRARRRRGAARRHGRNGGGSSPRRRRSRAGTRPSRAPATIHGPS